MKSVVILVCLFSFCTSYCQWLKIAEITDNDFRDIEAFENGNEILIVGTRTDTSISNGIIYKSVDAGLNWNIVQYHEFDSLLGTLYRVDIVNSNIAYVSNSGSRIYKSIDSGLTWDTLSLPTETAGPATDAMEFIDSETGLIGNYYGEIFKTIDGGTNWNLVYFLQAFLPIYDISCPSADICYARNSNPSFLKSIDGGSSWITLNNVPNTSILGGMHVLNKDTIVLLSSSMILRSINGGQNWDTIPSPVDAGLLDVEFKDNIGFAVGRKKAILKSIDYGETWTVEQYDSTSLEWINAVHIGQNTVLACSNIGSIYSQTIALNLESAASISNSISVYPNPTINEVAVHFNEPKNGLIEIYNTSAKLVLKLEVFDQDYIEIDLNKIDSGVLLMSFLDSDSNLRTIKKLLKVMSD